MRKPTVTSKSQKNRPIVPQGGFRGRKTLRKVEAELSTIPSIPLPSSEISFPAILTEMESSSMRGSRTVHKKPKSLKELLMRGLDMLHNGVTGAIIAAPTPDYYACWMRDQMYASLAYFYTNQPKEFEQCLRVIFDCIEQTEEKVIRASKKKPWSIADHIHAKFHPISLREITNDWGHHQVDAVGIFLWALALAEKNNIEAVETAADRRVVQLLVNYLDGVNYATEGDFGMWEEGERGQNGELVLRASSIGAAVAGLKAVKEVGLAEVPDQLITDGEKSLATLLPNETMTRDSDMALLSLIWPYRIVSPEIEKEILARTKSKLVQTHGLNRYWGDEYEGRSTNGVSAEWPMGFFWLSIIASDKGEKEQANYWFKRGLSTMTPEGYLPELLINGKPNIHTPLAWTHSFAAIAYEKLEGTAATDK